MLTKEEATKMTLETDLTTLLENRKGSQYFPATLTLDDGHTYQVQLKPRGKFRRRISEIPPLKMKISKKAIVSQGMDTLNEVKIVIPCYDNSLGDELVIREYLAYRMFEKVSALSLRARIVKLTIRDTHVEKSRKTMYALLVEDEEEIAARLNAVELEEYGLPADSLLTQHAALVTMFEYMIGNTDWDVSMLRNVRLLRSKEGGKVIIVPYDFDFSGFVNAPYATPSSETGLKTVRDRFLMSNGLPAESLRRAAQTLLQSRKELIDICKSRYLSRESAVEMISYLETFFQMAESAKDMPTMMKAPMD